ncbi:putative PurR-regulated permease PerM [Methylohalomonas lacus]|uniref:PurR-regulated permease PerM n=1 Tax=Methylohalomonas lacus TaxID=398773 RepID=A0AAE3HK43_9GAMM|nr:AI-2E family transporter [Methylohalomonas lacus]MCS3903814.1 putative PurR-regulated permease PerM [Methylohalomonas lacus]
MAESTPGTDRFRKVFILLLLLVVGATFLGMISNFIIALVLAGVFSALLYPLQSWLCQRLGGRSALAAILVLTAAVVVIVLPLLAMLGVVVAEAVQVSEQIKPWARELMSGDTPITAQLPDWLPYAEQLEPYRERILNKIAEAGSASGKWLVSSVSAVTQGTVGFLLSLFVMLYAMFFFLIDGARMLDVFKLHLPLAREDWDLILDRGVAVTRASLKGILVIGALQGLLVGLGLWAAGISGAAFWGTIVLILSAIPGLGAPLIWVPAAIYLFVTGATGWGIAMVVWGAVVVGLVDNVLRPIIVGRDTRLPDLLILVATLGGIIMFGAVGILLGPIIAAMLDTVLNIYRRAFRDWLPAD